VISMIPSRPFQDLLIATVHLKMTRLVLRKLIRLAAQAHRRAAAVSAARPGRVRRTLPCPIPIPGWPLVEGGPRLGSRRPAGTTQHHRECAVRRQRAVDLWPYLVRILPGEVPGNEC
jgi:hypothetical protein